MSMETLEWYLQAMEKELSKLQDGHFTGNMEFQVNFKDGNIANMNICLKKSIHKPINTNV